MEIQYESQMTIIFEIIKGFFWVHVHVCSGTYVYTDVGSQYWGLFPRSHSPWFLRQSIIGLELPIRIGWIANEPWGSAYLCLPCDMIMNIYQHTPFLSLLLFYYNQNIISRFLPLFFSSSNSFHSPLPAQVYDLFFFGYYCQICKKTTRWVHLLFLICTYFLGWWLVCYNQSGAHFWETLFFPFPIVISYMCCSLLMGGTL